MIGAVHYNLRAEKSGQLPKINGRFMHAVFFKILHEVSPTLENFVHEKMNIKPFTVSFLDPLDEIENFEDRWNVQRDDEFFWRVTCLNEDILNAAISVDEGFIIQAGTLTLTVENVKSFVTSEENFIQSVKNLLPAAEIEFNFVTPVSFRIDDYDAPLPRAELIFASIADKWTQAQMPAAVDKKIIRELATQIHLTEWQGRSKKFYFARDRGTLAFWGNFRYYLKNLDNDIKKVFMLLAKFAEYSGVGRLSGQGFGQTRVKFL